MRIETIGIALVLFSLFLTLGIGLYDEQVKNYGLPSDGIVMGKDYLAAQKATIDNSKNILQGSQVDTQDLSDNGAVAKAALPGSKDASSYETNFGQIMEYITSVLNLPSSIKVAIISIIGILIFAFGLYMLRGFQPQDK